MVPAGCLTPTAKEVRTTKWCRVSSVSVVQQTYFVQQPGFSIQAEKKPRRRLLSGTQERLEGHNLFGIRKFLLNCTIKCSKTSNKMNKNGRDMNLERNDSGRIGNIILRPLVR